MMKEKHLHVGICSYRVLLKEGGGWECDAVRTHKLLKNIVYSFHWCEVKVSSSIWLFGFRERGDIQYSFTSVQ